MNTLKQCSWIGLLIFTLASPVFAQGNETAQLLLNVEKLAQFKQILSDMKKGYTILNSGYATIKDLTEGNFDLHKTFLDGLLDVSPSVKNYRRITDIIKYQRQLVKEYRLAFTRIKGSEQFNQSELAYLGGVYNRLFRESLQNLDELLSVVTANKLRMSDDERLRAIDDLFFGMQDKLVFLRHFNTNAFLLARQRATEMNDIKRIRKLYGGS